MHVYVCELSFPAANAARERVFACAVSKVDAAAQRGGWLSSLLCVLSRLTMAATQTGSASRSDSRGRAELASILRGRGGSIARRWRSYGDARSVASITECGASLPPKTAPLRSRKEGLLRNTDGSFCQCHTRDASRAHSIHTASIAPAIARAG